MGKPLVISAVLIAVNVCLTVAVPVTVDLNPSDQLHIVQAIQEVEDRPSPLRVIVADSTGGYQHQVLQPQQLQYQQQQQWHHRQQQQQLRPSEPSHYQQGWDSRYQQNQLVKEQLHQHGADEPSTGSHFCVDGRCYALTPTQESPAEHQSHLRTSQDHHRLVKRSVETNDVRQRFQQPQGHHQVPQQQQQQQVPLSQGYSVPIQRPTPPPSAPTPAAGQQPNSKPNYRGQPVTGRPQLQDRTTTSLPSSKDIASSAAFEKAVMDFEKISDKISDIVSTFMIPIVRSSFDEGSSVLMIELDYSEAPNTAEATVETEEEV